MARRRSASHGDLPTGHKVAAGSVGALAFLACIAALAVLLFVGLLFAPGPPAKDGVGTTVILPRGASVARIGDVLRSAGAIRSSPMFHLASALEGKAGRMQAGEYFIPSGASMNSVLGRIAAGLIVHHRITIPEGLTSEQAVALLTAEPLLTGSAPVPPEGSLLPETYEFQRGEDRAAVLDRMTDAQRRLLGKLWDSRKPDLPFKTVDDAVALASIVEKETALPVERPHIAAVFVNRLRQGIRLESDPTVIYGLTHGRPLGHGLRQSELTEPTPYNTYLNNGLPPTPIGNPGRASITAVLDPAASPDLYFVANGAGGHVFSATLEAHNANVAKWRLIEKQREAAAGVTLDGGPVPPAKTQPVKAPAARAAPRPSAPPIRTQRSH